MSWGSWNEFWSMGGYALYVWGSYFVTAAVIAIEIVAVNRRKRVAFDNARTLRSPGEAL